MTTFEAIALAVIILIVIGVIIGVCLDDRVPPDYYDF